MKPMDNILLLKFGDFFLGKPKKPDYYLRGISKRNLVEAATRLKPFSQPGSPYFDYENLLRRFFSKKNHPFMEEILRRVKEIEKTGQRSVAILAPQSGYTLFEEVLAIDRSKDDFSVEEIEIKIFLACLAINQGLIEKEEKLIKYQEHAEEDEKIPTLILGALLPQADYLYYYYDRLTVSQIIKELFFFVFCQRILAD